MTEADALDVERLVERIRETIHRQRGEQPPAEPAESVRARAQADLDTLHATYDVSPSHLTFVSHRPLLGPFIAWLKQVMARLMAPLITRQVAFNGAAARAITELVEQEEAVERELRALGQFLRRQEISLLHQLREDGDGHRTRLVALMDERLQTLGHEVRREHESRQRQVSETVREQFGALAGQLGDGQRRWQAQLVQMFEEQVVVVGERLREQSATNKAQLVQMFEEQVAVVGERLREQSAANKAQLVQVFEEQIAAMETPLQAQSAAIKTELTRVVVERVTAMGERLREESEANKTELIQMMAEQVASMGERLRQARPATTEETPEFQRLRERVSRAERKLRRMLHLSPGDNAEAIGRTPEADDTAADDFDYFGFEERFRGSEESVKERQREYVPCFRSRAPILDIGCGRGEFLELLREAGQEARGVDLDLDMILLCQEKGLDVVRGDAFAYLDGLADASLGGVFCAQFVEHIEAPEVIKLIKLIHRKLTPGGVVVLETVNPECLMTFATSFYMDLSHKRPIHPKSLCYALESVGFSDVELRYTSPMDPSLRIPRLTSTAVASEELEHFNRCIETLNGWLYGYQDFAAIGRRGAAPRERLEDG